MSYYGPLPMIVARWARLVSEFGLLNALFYTLARALRTGTGRDVIRHYLFTAQPVPQRPLSRRSTQQIRVGAVAPDDYQLGWFPRPADVIADRFRQGGLCFAAFKGEEALGCLWLARDEYWEDEVACRFVPEPTHLAVWDFDVYVKPEHRGGRVFAYLWDEAFQWLRANGYQWTTSRVDAFNPASIRAHGRLGARVVGRGIFLVAGKLQISLFTIRPFVHLCWGRRHPPRVKVRAA
jgi:GNAT superfamily N-acetyltransferase